MPTDRVQHHSQQIPSRPHDHVTHRPMGTLPLPAANAATGFIPASATPVTRRYTRYVALHPLRGTTPVTRRCTRYEALHPIRRGAMPADQVQHHSQQIPSRLYDRVTHRPMGTLPLPAADAATGFIPASTAPVMGHYTRYEALHPIRRGAMLTDRVQRSPQQALSRAHTIHLIPHQHTYHPHLGHLPLWV